VHGGHPGGRSHVHEIEAARAAWDADVSAAGEEHDEGMNDNACHRSLMAGRGVFRMGAAAGGPGKVLKKTSPLQEV
jgi:hypothetical protein